MIACSKEEPQVPDTHVIFEEHFDDNSLNWPEFKEETAAASISDGMYYFRHKNPDTNFFYSIYMYKDFPYSDYTVETGLECIDPVSDFRYGIQWLRKDNSIGAGEIGIDYVKITR